MDCLEQFRYLYLMIRIYSRKTAFHKAFDAESMPHLLE